MLPVPMEHILIFSSIIFCLGVFGIFLNRHNIIAVLMSIELLLLAANINLVGFSANLGDLQGQILTMLILTVAAAEAAIGLAILVIYYRRRGNVDLREANLMKG